MRLLHVGLSAMLALGLAMPARAATSAAPADTTIAPPEEKKVCRASVETGSLIKKRRTCLTKAQWRAVDEEHEREAYKLVEDNRGKPSGN